MKNVSVYTLGGINYAGFRYRFFQYFNHMNINFNYNKSISDLNYEKVMPLGEKCLLKKVYFFFSIFIRISFYLIKDWIRQPDIIIISRALIKPIIPFFFRWILLSLKKRGTRIYWDIDDNILEFKEMSRKSFDFFCDIAEKIIISTPYLKGIIKNKYYDKVIILPTTDGMLIKQDSENRYKQLFLEYEHKIRLLWIGTSSGLPNLKKILNALESAGKELRKCGKELVLLVVCNRDPQYKSNHFTYTFKKWSLKDADYSFLTSHIGLMPLKDDIIEKGKGGFKLIQYLSIGIPSIASPVGINKEILGKGGGFLVELSDHKKWTESIIKLSTDIDLWNKCSKEAKSTYKYSYSYDYNFMIWKSLLEKYK